MKPNKIYNRQLKKWVEEEKPVGSLKKPDTCKGGRPHEFELVIPKYISTDHILTEKEILDYYKIVKDKLESDNKYDEKLKKIGIRHSSFYYTRKINLHYKCTRCGKEQIKYD
jgi:hypothetical protein